MRSAPSVVIPGLLALLAACSPREELPRKTSPPAPTAAKDARSYPVVGAVLSFDSLTGTITLDHEAIPGFMPPMAMPFQIDPQDLPSDLQVGDQVKAALTISAKGSRLRDLAVTLPALTPVEAVPAVPLLRPGQIVPDFAMTTQSGDPLRLSLLRGYVVVLTFIYTRCPVPEFCPLTDQKFRELQSRLAPHPQRANRVRLLSVSFDPEHDTPAVLASHALLRGAKAPLWTYAVASHEELQIIAPALGLSYSPTTRQIIHNIAVALISPEGRLLSLSNSPDWTPQKLLPQIQAALP